VQKALGIGSICPFGPGDEARIILSEVAIENGLEGDDNCEEELLWMGRLVCSMSRRVLKVLGCGCRAQRITEVNFVSKGTRGVSVMVLVIVCPRQS